MRRDFLDWSAGRPVSKIIAKETLNHRGLIEWASGLDVYTDTAAAYRRAYQRLGIDLVNRVPLTNAPPPCPADATLPVPDRPYRRQPLGVYDTVVRERYCCADPEAVWHMDFHQLEYTDLLTPVPHGCDPEDIRMREAALGEIGCYYPMLYTTLFMAPVEFLGWEIFMETAFTEPDRFHEHVLLPWLEKARAIIRAVAMASSAPWVFLHDDLATAAGPVFPPSWYEDYIFPHYREIFAEIRSFGKKVMLVADGNMSSFLPRLAELGLDGLMGENPATPLEEALAWFGDGERFYIGGIDTRRLTFDTPEGVRSMTRNVMKLVEKFPHFALSSCGGLHGNIPLENAIAYVETRLHP